MNTDIQQSMPAAMPDARQGGELATLVERELSVEDVSRQVAKIQELMRRVMKRDEHYGVIPGTDGKPSLYKPGAEKICFVFRLVPRYEVDREQHADGHVTYAVTCRLYRMGTDIFCGEGRGLCSTLETKYRYRRDRRYDIVEETVPQEFWRDKAAYQRQGLSAKKIDGAWKLVRTTGSARIENPDIADTYNTVHKMACKRAMVAAVLAATGTSDVFAQQSDESGEDPPAAGRSAAQQPRAAAPGHARGEAPQGENDMPSEQIDFVICRPDPDALELFVAATKSEQVSELRDLWRQAGELKSPGLRDAVHRQIDRRRAELSRKGPDEAESRGGAAASTPGS